MKKRILSVILSVLCLSMVMPLSVFANDTVPADTEDVEISVLTDGEGSAGAETPVSTMSAKTDPCISVLPSEIELENVSGEYARIVVSSKNSEINAEAEDPGIVSITKTGSVSGGEAYRIQPLDTGETVIHFTTDETEEYLSGSADLMVTVKNEEKKISDCAITPVPDQEYTGSEITPSVEITDGDTVLQEMKDYVITSYKNNTDVGRAVIRISGTGDYSGSVTVRFNICEPAVPCVHSLVHHDAQEASCIAEGNTEYWECSECGKCFADSSAGMEIGKESVVIAKTAHTLTHHAASAATCLSAGNCEYWTCNECGKYFLDKNCSKQTTYSRVVIKKLSHNLTLHKAKAATCTKDGYSAYYSCSGCGKYFSDSAAKKEIKKDSWVIKAKGHTYSDHVCTVCGSIDYISAPVLKKITAGSSSITVQWESVAGAASYRVYRKTEDGKWSSVKNTTSTSYTDKNVTAGVKYTYTVRCRNASGKIISSYDAKGLQSVILAKPVISVAANTSYIKVSWGKVAGASGYRVYRKAEGSSSYTSVATIKSASTLYYRDKSVQDGKTYTYCVKAYAKTTGSTVYSSASSKKSYKFDDGVYRYLAIGNSITLSGKCSYWWNECGMGASTASRDYFHRVSAWLKKNKGATEAECVNFASWETQYYDRAETLSLLDGYLDANLDLVTIQLGENCSNISTFRDDLIELVQYVQKKSPNAQIILVDNFWTNSTMSSAKYTVSSWYNLSVAGLEAIRDNSYYQCGLGTAVYDDEGGTHYVWHEGVAIHPGDRGMAYIASAIIEDIQ